MFGIRVSLRSAQYGLRLLTPYEWRLMELLMNGLIQQLKKMEECGLCSYEYVYRATNIYSDDELRFMELDWVNY
jgi:hypothetical protein